VWKKALSRRCKDTNEPLDAVRGQQMEVAMKLIHAFSRGGKPVLLGQHTRLAGKGSRWWRVALVPLLVTFLLASFAETAGAQKVYSIGSLNTAEQFISAFEGFRIRMAELGYRANHNVRYQFYNSRGKHDLLVSLAEKLIQDKVDLIVTSSTSATAVAAKATEKTRIPVLFLSAGNPEKLVKSYAGSGKNLAGISSASLELFEKRFELLKELAPSTKRVAVLHYPPGINYRSNVSETREAAVRFNLKLVEFNVMTVDEMEKSTRAINRADFDAIFAPPESFITEKIDVLVTQAIKEKMPLITSLLVNVERGCLATYAANYMALGKQGAALADKIFKGANPGSLPVEMPDKVNLVFNLKTAKAIDLKISKELLLRADQVFE
jgi:putative ABC transport system substrate-binding protein